jgi:putative membrane protein
MSTTDPHRSLPADRLAPAVPSGTLRAIEASNGPATAGVVTILVVSALATAFLLWLLYLHHPAAEYRHRLLFLPGLNAVLNAASAFALTCGFVLIRRGRIAQHRAAMLTAFLFSSIFLVSYILNHALHGDTLYPHTNPTRPLYLAILASHVLLSVVALPLVLITFFFSLTGRFRLHRGIARWTFPLWLYVSVTGVVVYLMLHAALR